jgi:hypothetical protein
VITATKSRYHSADQMAAAFVLGAALVLTPLLSEHNLVFLAAPIVLDLSTSTFLLGWIVAIPVGFLSPRSGLPRARVRPALIRVPGAPLDLGIRHAAPTPHALQQHGDVGEFDVLGRIVCSPLLSEPERCAW